MYLTCRLEVLRLGMQGRHGEFQPGKAQYSPPNFFDRLLARPRPWGPSQPWRPWDGEPLQARRKRGAGGARAPHFLSDQLTLSQPGGAHYPRPLLCAHPDFQTLRRPCSNADYYRQKPSRKVLLQTTYCELPECGNRVKLKFGIEILHLIYSVRTYL